MKSTRKSKNISGRLLRRMRLRREWTQEMLAEKLRHAGWAKCKRSWLARIETGEVAVKDLHLVFLRDVLGEEFEIQFWETVSAVQKAEVVASISEVVERVEFFTISLLLFGLVSG